MFIMEPPGAVAAMKVTHLGFSDSGALVADPLAGIWKEMQADWPKVTGLDDGPLDELKRWFKVPGFVEQNPTARQIDETLQKKFVAGDVAQRLADELLSGRYPGCDSLNGMVRQFAERTSVWSVHGKGVQVLRGPSPSDSGDQDPIPLDPGTLVDLVADWNAVIDHVEFGGQVFARCLDPKLSSQDEAWEPLKVKGVQARYRVLGRETAPSKGLSEEFRSVWGGEIKDSPFWVALGPVDATKRGKSSVVPVLGEGQLRAEKKYQTLCICQSKLVDKDGSHNLEDGSSPVWAESGIGPWPEDTKSWTVFCETLFARFKDPVAKLLKIDSLLSELTGDRNMKTDMHFNALKNKKNAGTALEVLADIEQALLTLDIDRLLAGCDTFASAEEKQDAVKEILDKLRELIPAVNDDPEDPDGEKGKSYDEPKALKRWKVQAELTEDSSLPEPGPWTREEWDEHVGSPDDWQARLHPNNCVMLGLQRLQEVELPKGTTLQQRLTLLHKLSTIDGRAGTLREQLTKICTAVDCVKSSTQLRLLLATSVEVLNFMRSAVKGGKLLGGGQRPSLKFKFLIVSHISS